MMPRLLDFENTAPYQDIMDDYGEPDQDDYYSPQDDKPKRKSAAGRELIRWDPDKDQLCLLCVDYICAIDGVAIPWDRVAQLMGSIIGKHSMSGEAIKQHLAKLHKFREEAKQLVPPKLDRTQRRRAITTVADTTPAPTPARGRGRRNATVDEEVPAPVTPVKPGSSLLFSKPDPKAKKAKAAVKVPVVARSGGRKKTGGNNVVESVEIKEEEDDDDGDFSAAPKKKAAAPRGNKRARKPKKSADHVDDNDLEMDCATPSKKPKGEGYLRPQTDKNYAEPSLEDDADGTPEGRGVKREQYSSQETTYRSQAPITNGHVGASDYRTYMQDAAPGYSFRGINSMNSLHSSPVTDNYGLGVSSLGTTYRSPPHTHIPRIFGSNNEFGNGLPFGNSGPGYGYAQNLGFAGSGSTTHANMVNAMSAMHNSQCPPPIDYQPNFGATAFRSSSPAGIDNVRASNSYGVGNQINTKAPESLDDNKLHIDTHLGGIDDSGSLHDYIISTTAINSSGTTGITPDMAQHGFVPLEPTEIQQAPQAQQAQQSEQPPLLHNFSFHSGIGGDLGIFGADFANEMVGESHFPNNPYGSGDCLSMIGGYD